MKIQKERRGWNSFISTDPNCSTIQLAITLKPLMQLGLKKVVVVTMQALSWAGFPGVSSFSIIDNILPYILGEEEKIEQETLKVLGELADGKVHPINIQISATCNRVNVKDGHLECVFVEFGKKTSIEDVKKAFKNFIGEPQLLNLPSAPKNQ